MEPERKIAAGFGVAMVLLMAIGGFVFFSVRERAETVGQAGRAQEVLEALQGVQSSLKGAESAGRGYAVTGQEAYLQPYEVTRAVIPGQIQRLRELTADDADQQRRLRGIESLIEAKLGLTQAIVAARKQRGWAGSAELIRSDRDRRAMEQIHQQIGEMAGVERQIFGERSRRAKVQDRRTTVVIVLGMLVALGTCAVAALLVGRDSRQRRRAETASEEMRREAELILGAAGEGIYRLDAIGNTTYINRAAARLLGYEPEELIGRPMHAFIHHSRADGSPYPREDCPIYTALQGGLSRHVESEVFWKKDASPIAVEYTSAPMREGARIIGAVVAFRAIGERLLTEENLRRSKQQLEVNVNQLEKRAREIMLLGEAGELLQSCQNVGEAFEVIVHAIRKLLPQWSGALCITNNSRSMVEAVATWGESLEGELNFPPEDCWALRLGRLHRVEHADTDLPCYHLGRPVRAASFCVPMVALGETLGVLHLVEPVVGSGPPGGPTDSAGALALENPQRLAMALADQIALALANLNLRDRLRSQSIRDSLTGLFNRRYLEESLERELRRAAREEKSLGVILIDLDHFKQFNDTFGHEAGDELLRSLGEVLTARTRKEDIACRYGGEEFLLILPNATLSICRRRAEHIRKAARSLNVTLRGQSLGSVSLSIGIAVFPQHGATAQTLLRTADSALYRAKAEGRDRIVVPADAEGGEDETEPPSRSQA